jgi:hypothetical protein
MADKSEKPGAKGGMKVYIDPSGATVSVSTSGTSISTRPSLITVPAETSISDEEFLRLREESVKANELFETKKREFSSNYGVEWSPDTHFTHVGVKRASDELVQLRDQANRLFGRLIFAASRLKTMNPP